MYFCDKSLYDVGVTDEGHSNTKMYRRFILHILKYLKRGIRQNRDERVMDKFHLFVLKSKIFMQINVLLSLNLV